MRGQEPAAVSSCCGWWSDRFDFAGSPRLVEERGLRAVEPQDREEPLARNRLNPVVLPPVGRCRPEVDVRRAVRVGLDRAGLAAHVRLRGLGSKRAKDGATASSSSIGLALLAVITAAGVVFVLGWATLGHLLYATDPKTHRRGLDVGHLLDSVGIGLAVVAGLGAAVGLTVSYRKQRGKEDKAFTDRYTDNAGLLGHENALARLADDWEPHRQTCVDVLCAYLRCPTTPRTPNRVNGRCVSPSSDSFATTCVAPPASPGRVVTSTSPVPSSTAAT